MAKIFKYVHSLCSFVTCLAGRRNDTLEIDEDGNVFLSGYGPAATRVEGAIGKVDKVIYIST